MYVLDINVSFNSMYYSFFSERTALLILFLELIFFLKNLQKVFFNFSLRLRLHV